MIFLKPLQVEFWHAVPGGVSECHLVVCQASTWGRSTWARDKRYAVARYCGMVLALRIKLPPSGGCRATRPAHEWFAPSVN